MVEGSGTSFTSVLCALVLVLGGLLWYFIKNPIMCPVCQTCEVCKVCETCPTCADCPKCPSCPVIPPPPVFNYIKGKINDRGYGDDLKGTPKQGFYDTEGKGAALSFCRYVGDNTNPTWSCVIGDQAYVNKDPNDPIFKNGPAWVL